MKQKWMSLTGLLLAGALGLSACGGGSKPAEPAKPAQPAQGEQPKASAPAAKVSITYWTPLTGLDGEYMKGMVDKFNSSQGKVAVEINTSVWENYYTKLTAAMGAAEAPDVAIVHQTYIPTFASKNALNTLEELVTKSGLKTDDFVANPWQATTYQGKRYAVPLDVHPLIWFYNLDIMQAAGLVKDGKPQIPANKDEFLAMAKTIKEKTGKGAISLQAAGWTSYREFYGLVYQNGGKILSDDGKKAAFNTPEVLEVLKFQVDLVQTLKYSPPGLTTDSMRAAWFAGDIAMQPNGVWNTGAFEDKKMNFATSPYPTLFKKPAVWANSHTLVLPKNKASNPQKQEAAMSFIKWLSDNSILWAKAGQIPTRKSVIDSADFKALKHQSVYATKLDAVVYPPASLKIAEIEQALLEHLQGAYAGKLSPEEALKNAEAKVNDILSK